MTRTFFLDCLGGGLLVSMPLVPLLVLLPRLVVGRPLRFKLGDGRRPGRAKFRI